MNWTIRWPWPRCARWIQEWLLEHPEAGAAALAQRRLRQLMLGTLSAEPTEAAWEQMLARLQEMPAPRPAPGPRTAGRPISLVAALLATAAAIGIALTLWYWQPSPAPTPQPAPPPISVAKEKTEPLPQVQQAAKPGPLELEPFPVATADEIEIIRVGGADLKTVIVGNFPVKGPLVLANPGEITLTRPDSEVRMNESACPDPLDAPGRGRKDALTNALFS